MRKDHFLIALPSPSLYSKRCMCAHVSSVCTCVHRTDSPSFLTPKTSFYHSQNWEIGLLPPPRRQAIHFHLAHWEAVVPSCFGVTAAEADSSHTAGVDLYCSSVGSWLPLWAHYVAWGCIRQPAISDLSMLLCEQPRWFPISGIFMHLWCPLAHQCPHSPSWNQTFGPEDR